MIRRNDFETVSAKKLIITDTTHGKLVVTAHPSGGVGYLVRLNFASSSLYPELGVNLTADEAATLSRVLHQIDHGAA
jgi:hypothetical protein